MPKRHLMFQIVANIGYYLALVSICTKSCYETFRFYRLSKFRGKNTICCSLSKKVHELCQETLIVCLLVDPQPFLAAFTLFARAVLTRRKLCTIQQCMVSRCLLHFARRFLVCLFVHIQVVDKVRLSSRANLLFDYFVNQHTRSSYLRKAPRYITPFEQCETIEKCVYDCSVIGNLCILLGLLL